MINKLRPVQQKETNLFPHRDVHGFENLLKAVNCFRRAAKYEFEIVKKDEQEQEDSALDVRNRNLPIIR